MKKKIKIVVVIVLYKTLTEESSSYENYFKYKHLLQCEQQLIIFNNSPETTIGNIDKVVVVNSTENKKLNTAYNFALEYANNNLAEWLLLLDSDSTLTEEYFSELSDILNSEVRKEIVSIVPSLVQNNQIISPHLNSFMYLRNSTTNTRGMLSGNITAFNSLSLLRVDFLRDINGFSPDYPLDMLDYWIYHQLHKKNKSIWLLNSKVEHNLSVLNFEENMTVDRYKLLIQAETRFFSNFNLVYKFAYRFKLLIRTVKQFVLFENKEFSRITLNQLLK